MGKVRLSDSTCQSRVSAANCLHRHGPLDCESRPSDQSLDQTSRRKRSSRSQETSALFAKLPQPCLIVRQRKSTNDTVHGTVPEIHARHSDRSE